MTLIRHNPNREFSLFPTDVLGMQRDINRMFDNFFRGGAADEPAGLASTWLPAVDVVEQDDQYLVKVELPGVSKDEVRVAMEDNVLTIRGEKRQEKETKKSSFHRVERSYGSFQRSFALPGTVKSDRIEASFKDGVLVVSLPKADEVKAKQIEVKVK